jgi:serine protease Do
MRGSFILFAVVSCGGSPKGNVAVSPIGAPSTSACGTDALRRSRAALDVKRALEDMNGVPASDLMALVDAVSALDVPDEAETRKAVERELQTMASETKSLAEAEDARWALVDETKGACAGVKARSKNCRETGNIPLAKDFSSLTSLKSALKAGQGYEPTGQEAKHRLALAQDLMNSQVKHLTTWDKARTHAKEALQAFATKHAGRCNVEPLALTVSDKPNMRDLTVIVESKPSAVVVGALRRLGEDGTLHRDFAAGLAEGGFGSGFVIVHPEGDKTRKFVVTNHHVVGDGGSVKVRVGKENLDAKLIYDDPNYDLAVLEVPSLAVSSGFALSSAPVHDRDEIIATGYPGISGRPSYQTTKGYISNEKYTPPSNDESALVYLQHTAPIDPGSSGGPVTNAKNEIVGVNTMKVVGRENVGIAVPGSEVKHALSTALYHEQGDQDRQRALRLACLQLVTHASALKPFRMKRLISEDYMARAGVQSVSMLQEVDEVWEKAWDAAPLMSMRVAIATRIAIDMKASEATGLFEDCSALPSSNELKSRDRVSIKFKTLRAERTAVFGWNGDRYQVIDYSFAPKK